MWKLVKDLPEEWGFVAGFPLKVGQTLKNPIITIKITRDVYNSKEPPFDYLGKTVQEFEMNIEDLVPEFFEKCE